jgi:hypothetical protein
MTMRKVNRKMPLALLGAGVGCTALAILFTAQVAIMGLLDRVGFAPQYSFLALNLVLIVMFAFLLKPSVVEARAWRSRNIIDERPSVKSSHVTAVASEPISKILIMRRVSQGKVGSSVGDPKENANEISSAGAAG